MKIEKADTVRWLSKEDLEGLFSQPKVRQELPYNIVEMDNMGLDLYLPVSGQYKLSQIRSKDLITWRKTRYTAMREIDFKGDVRTAPGRFFRKGERMCFQPTEETDATHVLVKAAWGNLGEFLSLTGQTADYAMRYALFFNKNEIIRGMGYDYWIIGAEMAEQPVRPEPRAVSFKELATMVS